MTLSLSVFSNNYQQQTATGFVKRPHNCGTDSLVFKFLETYMQSLGLNGYALDVGCGTGRSSRFIKELGFQVLGIDISEPMLEQARRLDPFSEYSSYPAGTRFPVESDKFDVILSTWAVLTLESRELLSHLMHESSRVLKPFGRVFIATNTPEFYSGKWISCDVDFPENQVPLKSGQSVVVRLTPEEVLLHDYFWSDSDYRFAFDGAGFTVKNAFYPTAPANETGWRDETNVAPCVIYELTKK